MNKKTLDFTDPSENLDSLEKEYLNILVNEIKLNDMELRAKFGERLSEIRNNLDIRRIAADKKIARKSRKHLVDNFPTKQLTETFPHCIKTLMQIMMNGKEHNRLVAAQTLLKPAISYLERHGIQSAELDLGSEGSDKFNFSLNVTPINGPKSN